VNTMRWTVIEHAGRPVAAGPSALLAAPGGTIGRSPDNHLVLPDEQRQISRLQATVRFDDEGRAVLRNMSAVLPISVNGRTLRHDEESPIAQGDRVVIGSYVLEAGNAVRAASAMAAPIPAAVAAPMPPASVPASASVFMPALQSVPVAQVPREPAPVVDALLPQAPVSDVFADLFGAGALPIGDTQPTTMRPPAPPEATPASMPAPVVSRQPAAGAPMPAPAIASPVHAAPPVSTAAPVPVPAPARSAMPTAADWDAILANAPRRAEDAPEPMPDPFAHEPFELPSQARRNPIDPLAELDPGATVGMSDFALKRGIDPLSLFAADQSAPSPLSDPRPTALTQSPALEDVHPATDLLTPRPAPTGFSHANHAHEVSGQFRPPTPMPLPSADEPVARKEEAESAPAREEPLLEALAREERAPLPATVASPVPVPVSAPATASMQPAAQTIPAFAPVPVAPTLPAAEQPVRPPAAPPTARTKPAAREAAKAEADRSVEGPPAAPLPAADCDALFRAFLDGAGVPDVAGQQVLDAEMMRRLGRLMRAFTDGTIELLSSRAMLKREVRAEITMIVDEENNPFKILPNGRAVLMQMFGARMPGFLSPEAAVHDALGDLQSHQLGMVAGMRAALLTVLQRFDPEVLKKETPHDGGFGEKLLPGGREARLWRQLQQLHAETTAAVEDDFQAVFGRAFQRAYDREMERLREARRA